LNPCKSTIGYCPLRMGGWKPGKPDGSPGI
jgi:hypothetical protein